MAYEPLLTRWDEVILRFIALYNLLKGAFFLALGLGAWHLVHSDLAQIIHDDLIEPFKLAPDGIFLRRPLDWVCNLTPYRLRVICDLFFFYGLIFAAEGVGLYLRKRWAEYMVIIVVTSLLPFEIYEIILKLVWWKVLVLLCNILVIAFFVRRIFLEVPKSSHTPPRPLLNQSLIAERTN